MPSSLKTSFKRLLVINFAEVTLDFGWLLMRKLRYGSDSAKYLMGKLLKGITMYFRPTFSFSLCAFWCKCKKKKQFYHMFCVPFLHLRVAICPWLLLVSRSVGHNIQGCHWNSFLQKQGRVRSWTKNTNPLGSLMRRRSVSILSGEQLPFSEATLLVIPETERKFTTHPKCCVSKVCITVLYRQQVPVSP